MRTRRLVVSAVAASLVAASAAATQISPPPPGLPPPPIPPAPLSDPALDAEFVALKAAFQDSVQRAARALATARNAIGAAQASRDPVDRATARAAVLGLVEARRTNRSDLSSLKMFSGRIAGTAASTRTDRQTVTDEIVHDDRWFDTTEAYVSRVLLDLVRLYPD